MSKKCSKMMLVLLFSVSAISVTIAEENKKIASLDEAKINNINCNYTRVSI
ncbi:MAG: hypothetical protein LBF88_06190 [Planctomycetaceae bacterium]|jgi:hypothetical protein|nr:hypothetical protein [Planctomycetaceae bacterium]